METEFAFDITDIYGAINGFELINIITKKYPINLYSFILEAGCGSGKFGINIALRYGGCVTLLDIDDFYIQYAIKLTRVVEMLTNTRLSMFFRRGDIMDLPFKKDTFDLVYNQGVAEHWTGEKRLKCINEMARVSRDCVIAIVPDAEGKLYQEKAKDIIVKYKSMPEKETAYTVEELGNIMKLAGLKDVECIKYSIPTTYEYIIGVGYK